MANWEDNLGKVHELLQRLHDKVDGKVTAVVEEKVVADRVASDKLDGEKEAGVVEEEVVDIPDDEETNAAATKLQAIQRGKKARQEVEEKKQQRVERGVVQTPPAQATAATTVAGPADSKQEYEMEKPEDEARRLVNRAESQVTEKLEFASS